MLWTSALLALAWTAVVLPFNRVTGAEGLAPAPVDESDRLAIGVVPQRPLEPGDAHLMREVGIDSVRFFLFWAQVESERADYDWSRPDALVGELATEGLTAFPYLYGSPTWVAERDGFDCEQDECTAHPPATIETRYAFASFAAAAVRRYGPEGSFWAEHPELPFRPIRTWQVWNEPNLLSYYRPEIDPGAYAKLVRAAAAQIRASDPGAQIILGGLSGNRTNARRESIGRFLRGFYSAPGASESVDGIAVHPYHPEVQGVYDQIKVARRVATSFDSDFDLWITEIGWASAGKPSWSLVTTRRGQARLLTHVLGKLVNRAKGLDLRGVYWYAWRDSERGEAVCGWCPAAGLLDRGGRAKPALRRLRRISARR